MSARIQISPDAAAHSAKNAPTAPGSTDQSRNRAEETRMVDTTTPVREPTTVTVEVREWNRNITISRANLLTDVANKLASNAGFVDDLVDKVVRAGGEPGVFALRAQVYREVEAQLRELAFVLQAPYLGLCAGCGTTL